MKMEWSDAYLRFGYRTIYKQKEKDVAYDQKDNSGSIFANDRKESENHPDGKGSCMIDGVEYWVSTWNKKTQEGKPWRSLAFTRKEAKQAKPPQRQQTKPASSGFDVMDEDIPFITSSMFYDLSTSKQRRMRRHDF